MTIKYITGLFVSGFSGMLCLCMACFLIITVPALAQQPADIPIVDALGQPLELSEPVSRVICSGPGCLRLLSYLKAQDHVIAVDDMEARRPRFDARPYALAIPDYRDLPVFGGFRGRDDPEKILSLPALPQVIFKTYPGMGHDPASLQKKTGIPVVVLDYGDLGENQALLYRSLSVAGQLLDRQDRARAVIQFFKDEIQSLARRTADLSESRSCFVGGIAFKGPHGLLSTEPGYMPFALVNAANAAAGDRPRSGQVRNAIFSKEKLLQIDPDIVFLDLSTLQMGENQGALHEIRTDPVCQALTSVRQGQVYGLLPYNWYTRNFGSVLANAWFVGQVLAPDRFTGIDPAAEADRIYSFLLGASVFKDLNQRFGNLAFTRLSMETGRAF